MGSHLRFRRFHARRSPFAQAPPFPDTCRSRAERTESRKGTRTAAKNLARNKRSAGQIVRGRPGDGEAGADLDAGSGARRLGVAGKEGHPPETPHRLRPATHQRQGTTPRESPDGIARGSWPQNTREGRANRAIHSCPAKRSTTNSQACHSGASGCRDLPLDCVCFLPLGVRPSHPRGRCLDGRR